MRTPEKLVSKPIEVKAGGEKAKTAATAGIMERLSRLLQILSSEEPFLREICPTQNINSLGARLVTERPWTPHSRVLVDYSGGDLWARVVYCQPLRPKAFAVGLQFLCADRGTGREEVKSDFCFQESAHFSRVLLETTPTSLLIDNYAQDRRSG